MYAHAAKETQTMIHDWADRWLGGFCAVGVLGGLPVRGADYIAHPPLDQTLVLPITSELSATDLHSAQAAWSDALGGAPVVLLRSVARARALLLQALEIAPGEAVGLPANASRELTEAVKQQRAVPRFRDLAADLRMQTVPEQGRPCRVNWVQPCGGAWPVDALPDSALLVDASDTVPSFDRDAEHSATATLYGLFLTADERSAGALLVCRDGQLAQRLAALAAPDDTPNAALARAQLQRLAGANGLAARQHAVLAAVRHGLSQAAGLPLLAATPATLAQSVAVVVPPPCDAATFYAYVLGEQTPVRWLPTLRPLHYAAIRPDGAANATTTAQHLARVLLVPVGPDFSEEEVNHTILGITKAADYLGVRWFTDPTRANWYAAQMNEWYGADHDGYRPLFAL
jgi:hypothetical protein